MMKCGLRTPPTSRPTHHCRTCARSTTSPTAPKNIRIAQALWSDARLAEANGRHLKVAGLDDGIARDVQAKLKDWTGDVWTIEPVASADARTLKEVEEARRRAEIEAVKSDPHVAAVLSAFPDAEVEAVLDDEEVEDA